MLKHIKQMIRITEIIDKVLEYNPDADTSVIDKAYVYAAKIHAGQSRLSGEPYLSHPLEVANILADMKLDTESIAAGLLHDVIEDSATTKEDIQKIFGENVTHIVDAVTKISVLKLSTKKALQAASLRKMILAMVRDLRVILIKLADRLHNMRTLKYHKTKEKQIAIAQETLDIYAPIAARLGIYWIKNELEEQGFFYALNEEYKKIKLLTQTARKEKEKYIKRVKKMLLAKMQSEDLKCKIEGRYKKPYSIYQKMTSQGLVFNEIYDLIAFRIILDSQESCYAVMGWIHSLWKPLPYKIKDYIAAPKSNGYKSIHTTVLGPKGARIEIQIRTKEMDKIAESGVAAHWSYKEGVNIYAKKTKAPDWVKDLAHVPANMNNPDAFLEDVKIDLTPGEIYVLTPQGDILRMSKGSTIVDFAYKIHSVVGDECIGARVNGKIEQLNYKLRSGEIVEIRRKKGNTPSEKWLEFVKTVKARIKIRSFIRKAELERSYTLGREICEKTFRKKGMNFNEILKSKQIKNIAKAFELKKSKELIAHVGFGKITPLQLINKTLVLMDITEKPESDFLDKKQIKPEDKKLKTKGIIVKGLEDVLVRFSKCCNPLPGEAIIGYITQGTGVTIHKKGCVNLLKIIDERLIEVTWSKGSENLYPVRIRVKTLDKPGALAEIAIIISKNKVNIGNSHSKKDSFTAGVSFCYFTIMVKDSAKLHKIMKNIRKNKKVVDVKRLTGTG